MPNEMEDADFVSDQPRAHAAYVSAPFHATQGATRGQPLTCLLIFIFYNATKYKL